MYELVITEKPNAMKKIAQSLADGKAIRETHKGVSYYKVTKGKQDIVVGCAVGHLYTVTEKVKSFAYPSFDIEWKPTFEVVKSAAFAKKYVQTLKKLSKDATSFTVATDYDIEGEVIGLNIVRFLCKQKDAARMKFSTLTKDELIESYDKKSKTLSWGQAKAGETRHVLDWYYGINLSRALTLAIKQADMYKTFSTGRVQGPSLKILADKEKEIRAFKSEPYWQIEVQGKLKTAEVIAWHAADKFTDEKKCKAIVKKVKGKDGKIAKIEKRKFTQKPPTPFDLTSLQTEAYRVFKIVPKDALEVAQTLYSNGFISYPRTSSQQLPESINYKKILKDLSKQDQYKALAKSVLKGTLKPNQGKKTDPAHPAIYPTGQTPKLHIERQKKIYDLIVKRFLACFGLPAERETVTYTIAIEKEDFIAKGTRTTVAGWHEFYNPYVRLEEQTMPATKEGDTFKNKDVIKHDKETQPPKRYTPASIIKELEKRNLGTKATRASILENLYNRGYIQDESITVTDIGFKIEEIIAKYVPDIVDETLTEHFEAEMEKIRTKEMKSEDVLDEAKKTLTKILNKLKKQEKAIGGELKEALIEHRDKESYIGPCQKCKKGNLRIMSGKKLKRRFIACDKYPDCETTFSLPVFGIVRGLGKNCEECNFPMVLIINGKKKQQVCINPECITKKHEDKKIQKKADDIASGKKTKKCPACKKNNLIVRTSVYGQFYGCAGYPKCKYTEKLDGTPSRKFAKTKPRK